MNLSGFTDSKKICRGEIVWQNLTARGMLFYLQTLKRVCPPSRFKGKGGGIQSTPTLSPPSPFVERECFPPFLDFPLRFPPAKAWWRWWWLTGPVTSSAQCQGGWPGLPSVPLWPVIDIQRGGRERAGRLNVYISCGLGLFFFCYLALKDF